MRCAIDIGSAWRAAPQWFAKTTSRRRHLARWRARIDALECRIVPASLLGDPLTFVSQPINTVATAPPVGDLLGAANQSTTPLGSVLPMQSVPLIQTHSVRTYCLGQLNRQSPVLVPIAVPLPVSGRLRR